MNTLHVTLAAPQGMRGGKQCPAERNGTPESDRHSPSRGRGALVWAIVASVFAAATVAFGQGEFTSLIYGIDDNNDLWQMELSGATSGTAKRQGTSTLTGSNSNGLAYDANRVQLFAVATSNNDSYLWWLPSGGTSFTSLGNISAYTAGIGKPASAAYYDNAYWFLGGGTTGNLLGKLSLAYTAGVPTGVSSGTTYTITGMPTAASGGGDMVITGSGVLYAYSAPGTVGGTGGNFFTADVKTAGSGTVGGYKLINSTSGTGLQLALNYDDTTLYGTDRRTGNWYTVNMSSGNLTQIPGFQTLTAGTVGFNDLGGSAQGSPVVPEPSTYAMALAGLACGGYSMWRRRKRC